RKAAAQDDGTCPICAERLPYDRKDVIFHARPFAQVSICFSCVAKAYARSQTCPFCRAAPEAQQGESVVRMMRRVEVGDAAAMCALGLAHLKGEDGLRPDAGRAIALFRKAAAKGHVQGHELTALCYQQGLGVSKNAAHAKRSLERAAAMG
ncbi:hypothetical protein M885DRAFT_400553, partial [Pelagophyceae sp. CCMP2097]